MPPEKEKKVFETVKTSILIFFFQAFSEESRNKSKTLSKKRHCYYLFVPPWWNRNFSMMEHKFLHGGTKTSPRWNK
ncbi:MAG: hypothetical protein EGP81_11370 [Bacteroides clarus]|nr:hypothetical protein [Bacteroides clarus]